MDYIDTLIRGKFATKIRLRLARVWNGVKYGTPVEKGCLEAVGIDEKGNAIHVVFEKSISPQYRASIIEGRIYTIYNPGCVLAKEWRPVAREDILNVVSGCVTKEEEETVADIRHHYFEWCTFQEVKARVNTNIFLSDVIGVLTKIQNPDQCNTKEGNAIFSKLWIRDLSGNELPVVLWGLANLNFRAMNLVGTSDTTVVAITSVAARKRDFGNEIYGQGMSATKVYVNLDIPETRQFLSRLGTTSSPPEIVEPAGVRKPPTTGRAQVTIDQLLTSVGVDIQVGQRYYCTAKVIGFDAEKKWYYTACKKCMSSVEESDIGRYCKKCNTKQADTKPCYKIHINVEDSTGATVFVVFGETADSLIGASVTNLVSAPIVHAKVIPTVMARAVGKTRTFEIVVNQNEFVHLTYQYVVKQILDENNKGSLAISQSSSSLNAFTGSSSGSSGTPTHAGKRPLPQSDHEADEPVTPDTKKHHSTAGGTPASRQKQIIEEILGRVFKSASPKPLIGYDGKNSYESPFKEPKDADSSLCADDVEQIQQLHAALGSYLADSNFLPASAVKDQVSEKSTVTEDCKSDERTEDAKVGTEEYPKESISEIKNKVNSQPSAVDDARSQMTGETENAKVGTEEYLKETISEINTKVNSQPSDVEDDGSHTTGELLQGKESSSEKVTTGKTTKKFTRSKNTNCSKKDPPGECN